MCIRDRVRLPHLFRQRRHQPHLIQPWLHLLPTQLVIRPHRPHLHRQHQHQVLHLPQPQVKHQFVLVPTRHQMDFRNPLGMAFVTRLQLMAAAQRHLLANVMQYVVELPALQQHPLLYHHLLQTQPCLQPSPRQRLIRLRCQQCLHQRPQQLQIHQCPQLNHQPSHQLHLSHRYPQLSRLHHLIRLLHRPHLPHLHQ